MRHYPWRASDAADSWWIESKRSIFEENSFAGFAQWSNSSLANSGLSKLQYVNVAHFLWFCSKILHSPFATNKILQGFTVLVVKLLKVDLESKSKVCLMFKLVFYICTKLKWIKTTFFGFQKTQLKCCNICNI